MHTECVTCRTYERPVTDLEPVSAECQEQAEPTTEARQEVRAPHVGQETDGSLRHGEQRLLRAHPVLAWGRSEIMARKVFLRFRSVHIKSAHCLSDQQC